MLSPLPERFGKWETLVHLKCVFQCLVGLKPVGGRDGSSPSRWLPPAAMLISGSQDVQAAFCWFAGAEF